jgi:hypothetical protein
MIVFRKIKPSSIGDSLKEPSEYMIIWLAPNGGIRQYLFTSTENERTDNYRSKIIDTNSDFRSVPNTQSISIDLYSMALTKDSYDYVTSIFESNKVAIVDKDGSITPCAISRGKKRTRNILKDYDVSISVMLQEPDLLNV